MRLDTDLIWLHGWQTDEADLYIGMDKASVEKAGKSLELYSEIKKVKN